MIELKIKNFRGHDNGMYLFESLEAISYIIYFDTLKLDRVIAQALLDIGEIYENNYCKLQKVEKSSIKKIGKIINKEFVWITNKRE